MTPAVLLNRKVLAVAGVALALFGVAVLGVVMAITGAGFGCTSAAASSTPTGAGSSEIPPARLRLYQAAGRRFDIDWAFLASIGAQECHHGSCAGDNGSGCAGPMQIAVRRGSPCSPGNGPTLWERYGVDADHDGHIDPDDPADAIFTAARILREAKHAPPTGGSYKAYYNAACTYYGACGDSTAQYADEVMARAVSYGFGGDQPEGGGGGCGGADVQPVDGGRLGDVVRDHGPGGLAALSTTVTAGTAIECDRRIRPDVIWLARRYRVTVTACYAIHASGGEHPLGAAVDLVPSPGVTWQESTERLARVVGWKRSCAASGAAPACARPPFRFIGYDGYPGHGDPAHCHCAGNA
ncbi:MAG: hypothetical protein JWQ18_2333, partial [Conexibacter sp.]|nr:hypothetical protein [Conexibacter sp.]